MSAARRPDPREWARQQLDPRDVHSGWTGIREGSRRPPMARTSRAETVNELEITLTHAPTGIKVTRATPPANYSCKEAQRLRRALEAQLFDELARNVVAARRLPGNPLTK